MVETTLSSPSPSSRKKVSPAKAVTLKEINTSGREKRVSTGWEEMDRVLGGGMVKGQAVLFAGEPGIGKSTLLTQLSLNLAKNNHSVVYLCGEESPQQVSLRIRRLSPSFSSVSGLFLLPEVDVDAVLAFLENQSPPPSLVVIDSVQTITTQDLTGVAGSVGQVRECSHRLISWAKKAQVPIFLIGHITKEGNIAGPKVLEHAVDTVIYFEGERRQDLRLLRAVKNRFGATDEVGIFKMTQKGLVPLKESFLGGELDKPRVGSALTVVNEGSRMILVEIQALVTQTFTPLPRRIITGLERNRTEMLLAVCQKQLRLPLFKYDVFVNVAGGLKINEPAADLAVCAAVVSSYKNKPLPLKSCFVGEVSLLGEIFPVGQMEKRKKIAQKRGILQFFTGKNLKKLLLPLF